MFELYPGVRMYSKLLLKTYKNTRPPTVFRMYHLPPLTRSPSHTLGRPSLAYGTDFLPLPYPHDLSQMSGWDSSLRRETLRLVLLQNGPGCRPPRSTLHSVWHKIMKFRIKACKVLNDVLEFHFVAEINVFLFTFRLRFWRIVKPRSHRTPRLNHVQEQEVMKIWWTWS